jgi:hypothetical protein
MTFSREQVAWLAAERITVIGQLDTLQLECIERAEAFEGTPLVREHLIYGVGRRCRTLKRAINNIFELLPPTASVPVPPDQVSDAEINLHAFVLNLAGLFDNWAWAFVLRHSLDVGGPQAVGLFNHGTAKHLPQAIREYLSSKTVTDWYSTYVQVYRDALVHRLPLYIPPAVYTPEEGQAMSVLETGIHECLKRLDTRGYDQIVEEKGSIGRPCFAFFHSFADKSAPKPVQLHPQLICDAKLVAEFGALYFQHWESRA